MFIGDYKNVSCSIEKDGAASACATIVVNKDQRSNSDVTMFILLGFVHVSLLLIRLCSQAAIWPP